MEGALYIIKITQKSSPPGIRGEGKKMLYIDEKRGVAVSDQNDEKEDAARCAEQYPKIKFLAGVNRHELRLGPEYEDEY